MSVEVLSVEYFQSGTKIGRRGVSIKVVEKRLTLLCHKCGNVYVRESGFWAAKSKSCGCAAHDPTTTHGLSKHPLYGVWHGIRDRCLNPNGKDREYYSERGITICAEWDSFKKFFDWAIAAGWEQGLLIDRKNNDGNYEPSNCRFVTILESNRNRSNVTMTVETANKIKTELETNNCSALADKYGTTLAAVKSIKRGLSWLK